MLGQAIGKNGVILAVFALCTAGILAGTYQLTKGRIVESEKRAQQQALFEVVPAHHHDNDMLADVIPVPPNSLQQLGLSQPADIHLALQNGELVAAVIPATAPDGYSGAIRMIVGVNANGTIAGVRILAHNETPGLGDKVDIRKSDWVMSFNGKSLTNPSAQGWSVKKDGGSFDQFTGATITPRAVVSKVHDVLNFFQTHQAAIVAASTVDPHE